MDMELDAIRQRDGDYCSACADGTCSLAKDGLHHGVSLAEVDRHALLERIAKLERERRAKDQRLAVLERDLSMSALRNGSLRAAAQAVVEALRNPGEPDAVIKAIDVLAAELEGSTGR